MCIPGRWSSSSRCATPWTWSGEHTIEPLTDQQVRSARISSFSRENPEGEVHLAGSVQLEVNPDHIVVESNTRRKDAGDPVDYRTIGFVNNPAAPSGQQLSNIQFQNQGSSVDYRTIGFVDKPADLTPEQLARIQPKEQKEQVDHRSIQFKEKSGDADYSKIQFKEKSSDVDVDHSKIQFKDRPENGSAGKGKRKGSKGPDSSGGGSGADYSKIKFQPGQGLAKSPDAYSGLVGGGGNRSRGGGRKKREEDDEKNRQHQRPIVQVVLNN